MHKIKVGWYIPVNHNNYNKMPASVWIRSLQLIPYLKKLGIESVINSNEKVDIAIFVRWQDEKAYQLAKTLKDRETRIIFDMCVNYFDETDVPGLGNPVNKKHVDETIRMISIADAVTTASNFIANRARDYHNAVNYLPDSIDIEHFKFKKRREDFYRPYLRAIWSGVASKAFELEPVLPLLKHHGIDLVIISNSRPNLKIIGWFWKRKFPYQFYPWQYETFPHRILEGEIGISHRSVDNPYNSGHSFFKIGVLMAQGIPCLVSPQPSYIELINNQESGKVCDSLDEWEITLSGILRNREKLVQWSSIARKNMQKYSTEEISNQYIQLFNQIVEASQ